MSTNADIQVSATERHAMQPNNPFQKNANPPPTPYRVSYSLLFLILTHCPNPAV